MEAPHLGFWSRPHAIEMNLFPTLYSQAKQRDEKDARGRQHQELAGGRTELGVPMSTPPPPLHNNTHHATSLIALAQTDILTDAYAQKLTQPQCLMDGYMGGHFKNQGVY